MPSLSAHVERALFRVLCSAPLQKKKAEGPTEPQQPAKKQKLQAPAAMATPQPPDPAPKSHDQPDGASAEADRLKAEIEAQGSKVRELKASGAEKVSALPI